MPFLSKNLRSRQRSLLYSPALTTCYLLQDTIMFKRLIYTASILYLQWLHHSLLLLFFQLIGNGPNLEVDQVLQASYILQSQHVFVLDLIMLHQQVVGILVLHMLNLDCILQIASLDWMNLSFGKLRI